MSYTHHTTRTANYARRIGDSQSTAGTDGSRVLTRKLLLTLSALLLTTLALEAFVRAAVAAKSSRKARTLAELGRRPPPAADTDASLADLLRPSANPRLVFELRPNLKTRFMGKSLTTDSRGFRSSGHGPATADSIRILGLGDSFMFGWGVSDGETFLARLPSRLSRRLPDTVWETTNGAVPGYNTAMEVEVLRDKGLETKPDLVILGWVNNDLDLPSFLRRLPSALSLDRSFLASWIASRLSLSHTGPFDTEVYTIRPFREDDEPDYFATLTEEERRIAGYAAFTEAMARLKATLGERDLEIVVLAHGRPPRFLKEACEAHGFPLVVIRKYKERFLRENDLLNTDNSVLTVSSTDPHPSELGHQLIAFGLSEFLVETGLASRLVAKRSRG